MSRRRHALARQACCARQDPQRETVTTRAMVDADARTILGVRVRVSPAIGEKDGGALVEDFKTHVKRLRDLVWEKRIRPLEAEIVVEYRGRLDELLVKAGTGTLERGYFDIDIDPSGQAPNPPGRQAPNRAQRRRKKR